MKERPRLIALVVAGYRAIPSEDDVKAVMAVDSEIAPVEKHVLMVRSEITAPASRRQIEDALQQQIKALGIAYDHYTISDSNVLPENPCTLIKAWGSKP